MGVRWAPARDAGPALRQADGGSPSANLRDGTLVQRVIAERHRMQRPRLGWGEAEVRREFQILREELAAAVRRRVRKAADFDVGEALALFRFVDHAEAASRRTLAAGAVRVPGTRRRAAGAAPTRTTRRAVTPPGLPT